MNRRDFLKYLCGLLALIPFLSYNKNLTETDKVAKVAKNEVSFWVIEWVELNEKL